MLSVESLGNAEKFKNEKEKSTYILYTHPQLQYPEIPSLTFGVCMYFH